MSEARSTASAISQLPEDILWHTFYFVAQTSKSYNCDPSALIDLRCVSQVCASWRRLLLASSSLWGMTIELEQFGQRTCYWREEVLRRTGNSLLDIQGCIDTRDSDVLERFFASLLNDHWPRIRTLNLWIDGERRGHQIMGPAMSSAFQKPAPCLDFFAVDLDIDPFGFSSTTFRLFADQAPRLQEFICPYFFRPRPQKLWLSNLRVLEFTCHWTARALLGTLANMPLLESLQVTEEDDDEREDIDLHARGRTSLPHVTLPRLKRLSVDPGTALQMYFAVLEHLVPAPGLYFSINTNATPLVRADFIGIQQIFRSYLHISFKGKYPDYLKIIRRKKFIIIDMSRGSYEFDFHLTSLGGEEIQDLYVAMFLETLRSISFEYTTRFFLGIHVGALGLTKTALNSIVSSMASIEELRVTADSLQLLISFPIATGHILFPQLKTLQLVGHCDVALLLGFLTPRHALELPIRFLEFFPSESQPEFFRDFRDFRPLEQFDGLKITWSLCRKDDVHEYICGSGNPDILYYYAELA
ncbi:hypothetical protein GALMADRAFT_246950 [Galerina marginata CBS 339.88]|uniref:F-box domain-containing protein n=1 Tax=Galerina marginata (strain CBS 339.88) TaxID=685588 RepID=A0A067T0A3_GALM3|nr:hypothetical protein GALMADRAFT_246950 [Galerina marginata CBS 339.88]